MDATLALVQMKLCQQPVSLAQGISCPIVLAEQMVLKKKYWALILVKPQLISSRD